MGGEVMKKIICLFTMFISIFIFQTDFKVRSQNEFDKLNNLADVICANEHTEIVSVFVSEADKEFFEKLIKYTQSQDETILISRSTQTESLRNVQDYYVYTSNSELTLKDIHVRNGHSIDFGKPSNQFYSSDHNNMECVDYIDFLNSKYNKDYSDMFNIHQISDVLNDKSTNKNLYIQISSKDKAKSIQQIKASNLAEYLPDNWDESELGPIDISIHENALAIRMIIVSSIAILLLTICSLFKQSKEITIRKMFGMKNGYILVKLFVHQFFLQIASYVLGCMLSVMIMIGHLRPVTYELVLSQFQYFIIFLCLQLLLFFIVYVVIKKMNHIHTVKKGNLIKEMAYVDIGLKVIVVLMIMNPMLQFISQSVNGIKTATYLITYEDTLRNQFYISGLYDTQQGDINANITLLRKYFDEHGGVYQDFFQNDTEWNSYDENDDKKPYLIVSKSFLHDYQILNDHGEVITFDNFNHDIILVPEKYKDEDLTGYRNAKKAEKLIVENGMTYVNRDPLTAFENNLFKTDAIVLVKSELDASTKWSYPFLLLPGAKDTVADIKESMSNAGIVDGYTLGTTNNAYESTMQFIKDQVIYLVSLLILYFIVIMVFLYQTVYVYFITNKKKFALKYLLGDNFVERHGEMIVVNISAYIVVLLCGWYFMNIELYSLISFVFFAITFELISANLLIRKFEKNNVALILKD